MLDKESRLDPPGINLRAAQVFDATDLFVTGFANTFVLPPASPHDYGVSINPDACISKCARLPR